MKNAVIALTAQGADLGECIALELNNTSLYIPSSLNKKENLGIDFFRYDNLGSLVKDLFCKEDGLIFIMSTGIVVRMIAPNIKSKISDPAIVVLDEKGQNVISLLSGHIGGANKLSYEISGITGGRPVITTASDVNNITAIDMFALEMDCRFKDFEMAKKITIHLIHGGKVGIYIDSLTLKKCGNINLPKNYYLVDSCSELEKYPYGIYVSNKNKEKFNRDKIIQLYPKNIVIGVGCKKNIPKDLVINSIKKALFEQGISENSILKIATIEDKSSEIAINKAVKFFNANLEIIKKEKIREIEKDFMNSSFVEKSVGVKAVSGPCAYISSGKGKILLEKKIFEGVTISIAEKI